MKISKNALLTIASAAGLALVKSKIGSQSFGILEEVELEIQFTACIDFSFYSDGQCISPGPEIQDLVYEITEYFRDPGHEISRLWHPDYIARFENEYLGFSKFTLYELRHCLKDINVSYQDDQENNYSVFWEVANKLKSGGYGENIENIFRYPLDEVFKIISGTSTSTHDGYYEGSNFHFKPFMPESFADYKCNTKSFFQSFCDNLIKWGLSTGRLNIEETYLSNFQAFIYLLDLDKAKELRDIITVEAKVNLFNNLSKEEKEKFLSGIITLLKNGLISTIDTYWETDIGSSIQTNWIKTSPDIESLTNGRFYRPNTMPNIRKR